ncbi:MAG: hypothetical protein VXX11_02240, partial [Planctomycetota bacterium]|nr:hypothetical protein [Planctomycetota bacterium]
GTRTSIPRIDGNPIRMAVGVLFACGSCRGRGHGQNEIERCCWYYYSRLDLGIYLFHTFSAA